VTEAVPRSLRLAAAIAWRVLVVAAAIALLAFVLARLRVIVVPLAVAILLSTFLVPLVGRLRQRGVPAALAALVVLAAALVLVGGTVAALVPNVAEEWGELDLSVQAGVDEATAWLADGPLGLSESSIDEWKDRAVEQLRSQSGRIAGGVFGGAYLALELVAGLVLMLVTLFFVLKDGEQMWRWFVSLFPSHVRGDVDAIGQRSWQTAGAYIRGITFVALVDAIFIGLAIWLIGVPLVLPLAALTFIGGFFPIIGAFAAGFAAAMVALVSEGWVAASLVVGATLLVQQLEGNVLQPLIVGNAVRLHPLAILLAVTAGGIVWGIAGAFLAVPLVAVVTRAASYLASRAPAHPARAGP
jgi:predicted PurR-regulated permease PerM